MSDIKAPDSSRNPNFRYVRVAEDIAGKIASKELVSGDRLRSERDLAEHYGVAFHTVRKAMAVLRERDLVVSIHGRGTFVV